MTCAFLVGYWLLKLKSVFREKTVLKVICCFSHVSDFSHQNNFCLFIYIQYDMLYSSLALSFQNGKKSLLIKEFIAFLFETERLKI